MNEIILKGVIQDIEYSHNIKDVEYYKANLITEPNEGIEYIIPIKFKRFCNKYQNNQKVTLKGNIRSYSTKGENKNSVNLYIFTYQDDVEESEYSNHFIIDGRICKKNDLVINKFGKCSISFILANNIETQEKQHHLNSYLPCLAFGREAKEIRKLNVGDQIKIEGYIRSRQYKKKINTEEDYIIKITHELIVKSFEVVTE